MPKNTKQLIQINKDIILYYIEEKLNLVKRNHVKVENKINK